MINPIPYIQAATADRYGLAMADLLGPRRSPEFARPRQIAMTLSAVHTNASLPQVGRHFSRDHTTVLHARDAIGRDWDEQIAEDCLSIMIDAHKRWEAAKITASENALAVIIRGKPQPTQHA